MKYIDFKKSQEEKFSAFPLFYAFNEKQLKEGLQKLECEESDLMKINHGGFIRKADKEKFVQLIEELAECRKNAFADDSFLIEAIEYELDNHEFCISETSGPVLGALGLSLDDERVFRSFQIARKNYFENVEY
jgi:hypothetical protein